MDKDVRVGKQDARDTRQDLRSTEQDARTTEQDARTTEQPSDTARQPRIIAGFEDRAMARRGERQDARGEQQDRRGEGQDPAPLRLAGLFIGGFLLIFVLAHKVVFPTCDAVVTNQEMTRSLQQQIIAEHQRSEEIRYKLLAVEEANKSMNEKELAILQHVDADLSQVLAHFQDGKPETHLPPQRTGSKNKENRNAT